MIFYIVLLIVTLSFIIKFVKVNAKEINIVNVKAKTNKNAHSDFKLYGLNLHEYKKVLIADMKKDTVYYNLDIIEVFLMSFIEKILKK